MPTFIHGKAIRLWVDQYDFARYFRDITVNNSVATAEITGFSSVAKEYIVGLEEGTISLQGFYESTALVGTDQYFGTILGVATKQKVIIAINGHNLGTRAVMALVDTSSYNLNGSLGDVAKADVTFVSSSNAVEQGILLTIGAAISATGLGTGVDNGALTSNGGVGFLSVPVDSRNGTVIVKIQHSVDNSTFADLVTFTTVVAATPTSERIEVAAGTTINRYLRVSYTVAGTTGSATPVVAFSRR